MLNVAKDIQGINSGWVSNDNIDADFSTPQSRMELSSVLNRYRFVRGALSHGFINL